jgi:EAL domain-containing protein (putative c-di-GMP-specific phosphodiesterase class I)
VGADTKPFQTGGNVSARWTDGDDDARIDVVLRRRVLRAAFQPIVRFERGLTAGYHASVRGPLGSPLEHESQLSAVAAHRGVGFQLDELRLHTILDAAYRAKLAAPLTLFVSRTVDAVLRAPFALRDGALPIVVVLDASGAPEEVARAATRVRAEGCAVALRELSPDDAGTALLAGVAPEFVVVDGRTHDVPGAIARTGATLLASGVDHEADAAAMVAAGIGFGYGQRFGRPDLLVRPPAIFDHDGLAPAPGAEVFVDERS